MNGTAVASKLRVVVSQAALDDYCRVLGVSPTEAIKARLREDFGLAQYLGDMHSGAQRWRGRRPRRLTFIVHRERNVLTIGRVQTQHAAVPIVAKARRVVLRVDGEPRSFDVLDLLHQQGGDGVALSLVGGVWATAKKGARQGHVEQLRFVDEPPEWALKQGVAQGA